MAVRKTVVKETRAKIKYSLLLFDKTLIFQVQEQEGVPRGCWTAKNGLNINSYDEPTLYPMDQVYIRGTDKKEHNKVCIYTFSTEKQAQLYRDKVIEGIAQYIQHLNQRPRTHDRYRNLSLVAETFEEG